MWIEAAEIQPGRGDEITESKASLIAGRKEVGGSTFVLGTAAATITAAYPG